MPCRFTTFAHAAKSWKRERHVVARLEASTRGFDARYVVTSLSRGGSKVPAPVDVPISFKLTD